MRYSGIQPQYFPRLHYFARAFNTDIFVIRDDVQFVVRHKYPDGHNGPSFQAHTPIKTSAGLFLLNVPTLHQGLQSINNTQISYSNDWILKHKKTIEAVYSRAPYFPEIYPMIKEILGLKLQTISELNIVTFLFGINILLGSSFKISELNLENINARLKKAKSVRLKRILRASEITELKGKKLTANEKILTIIKTIRADEDYTGGTAFNAYMDEDLFKNNNIKVVIQDWRCERYSQLFENKFPFLPNLSIIDLLMNVSASKALDIIRG